MPFIADRRIRTQRRLYRGGRGIAGLGGSASDCGPGQIYDPYYQFLGITGQCVTQAQSDANKAANPSQYPGGGGGGGAGITDVLAAAAGAVGKIFGQQPQVVMPQQTGPDMTTILVLGGLGLGAVLLLTRKSS